MLPQRQPGLGEGRIRGLAKDYRIIVGSQDGLRSTVWKFSVHCNDIYIMSRMFGADSKVSLHESGQCQWSLTGSWVVKSPERKNTDRHIVKWVAHRPNANEAQHIFRIHIPESELRNVGDIESLKGVNWISPPPAGAAVSLECYITPVCNSDPALQSNLPYPVEISIPLDDGRWFVAMRNITTPSAEDIEHLRIAVVNEVGAGYISKPEHRVAAFTELPGPTRGLIELCPFSP